nr:peptidoglycan-binding protein [uncultured Rhodopila sp.]
MAVDVVSLIRRIEPSSALPAYLDAVAMGQLQLKDAGIDTPLRISHFFAQALHETGRFTIARESLNYSAERLVEIFGVNRHSAAITDAEAARLAHDQPAIAERVYGLGNPHMAQELGNTQPGDGYRYRGNGVLQMTGRGAHRKFGLLAGVDFEGNPDLVTLPEHALKPAIGEWSAGNLNVFADKDDIRTITRVINGGFNGLSERQDLLDQLKQLLIASGDLPAGEAQGQPDTDIVALQKALNTLGADPKLDMDGQLGPTTKAALKEFQRSANLVPDGVPGPVTWAKIRLQLASNP